MGEIKATDVVRLRSGGPAMTVLFLLDRNGRPGSHVVGRDVEVALCLWHDEHGVAHEHAIPVDCLMAH